MIYSVTNKGSSLGYVQGWERNLLGNVGKSLMPKNMKISKSLIVSA